MPQLVFVRSKKPAMEPFEFNPNVNLATVPHDCKALCFVLGESDLDSKLKADLEQLGKKSGKNLFVGYWNMADYQLQNLISEYDIQKIPCILVTGLEEYSSVEDDQYAFVKVPDRLLKAEYVEETKELIRQLYLSFIKGDVKRAVSQARKAGHKVLLHNFAKALGKFTEAFLKLLGEVGLEIEYAGAKFTLGKDSGNSGNGG